ncbi:MAG: hypothetical protein ACXW4B_08660 [Micavibrio sp.]
MLDPTTRVPSATPVPAAPPRAVFRMVENDRMGGSVPAWVRPVSAQDETLAALSGATFSDELSTALSYRTGKDIPIDEKPFGFGDLVDIVNPLQHLPIIGAVYREITGDQIRPSSEIIGGAVFGGMVGAAGSLANVILREETGHDLTGHAVRIAQGKPAPEPVQRLAAAGTPDIPGTALSFVDLGHQPIPSQPSRFAAVYKFNE